jgi:hypothetical protein
VRPGYLGRMGFDPLTGVIVIVVIALAVLAFIVVGRKAVKAPGEDEGINASTELTPHEPGHVGRVEPSDAENRTTAI